MELEQPVESTTTRMRAVCNRAKGSLAFFKQFGISVICVAAAIMFIHVARMQEKRPDKAELEGVFDYLG
jgi:hypothetical protein